MWTREQLKNNAKINMKRNYWSCVAVAFIMSVVEGIGAAGGVRSGSLMLSTPHKNCVSRKNTMEVDSSIPSPRQKITRQARKKTARTADLWNSTPVMTHTISSGISEITRFTTEDMTRVNG